MPEPPLVLASSSVFRKTLLERLQIPFTAIAPEVDETRLPGESASDMVRRLSLAKARALAAAFPDALIIGSDQCACLGDVVIGKPRERAEAAEQLARASGRSVLYRTGLCLLDTRRDLVQLDEILYEVRFRTLNRAEIGRYLAKDQPYVCAGSIRSESLGISLFESMRGDDPSALIGLPLIRLCEMLRTAGISVP